MTNEQQSTAVAPVNQNRQPSLLAKMAERYEMDPNKFAATIKETCIKGNATNEQFAAFLMVAEKYGLNPLTKEVHAFADKGGGIVPIVGVDGWARMINDHPAFDGMDFEDLREDGRIVAITCRMYRKDRAHPIQATEYMAECKRGTQPWQQWPTRMLRHKAMIQAARYAFGFSGIVEPDEYERRFDRRPDARPLDQKLAEAAPMKLDHANTAPAPAGDTSEVTGADAEAGEADPDASPAEASQEAPAPKAVIGRYVLKIAEAADAEAANAVFDELEATPAWADATDEEKEPAREALAAKLTGSEE